MTTRDSTLHVQVMGPDEYHAKVDNNVYTNIVAALAIYMADFRWLITCKHVTQ